MRDMPVSAILCAIIKSENNYSYWGLYNHFKKHPDDVELCGLKKQYCRSWYHLRISGVGPNILQLLIAWSAGDDAKGTQLVDSAGTPRTRTRTGTTQNTANGRKIVRKAAHNGSPARQDNRSYGN